MTSTDLQATIAHMGAAARAAAAKMAAAPTAAKNAALLALARRLRTEAARLAPATPGHAAAEAAGLPPPMVDPPAAHAEDHRDGGSRLRADRRDAGPDRRDHPSAPRPSGISSGRCACRWVSSA
jgi:glutamate-5-semialdehyde dehydrogenase